VCVVSLVCIEFFCRFSFCLLSVLLIFFFVLLAAESTALRNVNASISHHSLLGIQLETLEGVGLDGGALGGKGRMVGARGEALSILKSEA